MAPEYGMPTAMAAGAGAGPSHSPSHSHSRTRLGTYAPTPTTSEDRLAGARMPRPRTTAGWSATATNTRRTRGRTRGPAADRDLSSAAAGGAGDPAPPGNPGSGPTSSLIAVLLVATSARGPHVIFQWPPRPHLLRRLSQVRYYNNPERERSASAAAAAGHRFQSRRGTAIPEEEQRASYAFDRQHNAPAEHPKSALLTPSFSRRYRANHDSSSSASDDDDDDDNVSTSSDVDDLSWSSADETESMYTSQYDAEDDDDDDDGMRHTRASSITEGDDSTMAYVSESAESDSASVRRFYRSRHGSAAPASGLRNEVTATSISTDVNDHPQRRTRRAASSNLGRSASRMRAALFESTASMQSSDRLAGIDGVDRSHLSALGPGSPQMSVISDTPSERMRKAKAYDTYLGYQNSFLAELLSPRRSLCHQKFELTVDDLVFVGHPVCADDREGWTLGSKRGPAEAAVDSESDLDQVLRGRALHSVRHSTASDFPNPAFASGERSPFEEHSPFEPSPRSTSFAHLQQAPLPGSRSRVRRDASRPSTRGDNEDFGASLSSFHFVLVLDKPDPAPPYLPPGMASIIPASQLNSVSIDPNLSAQLYYDNIAFKMTAALYNEQCTRGYVSQEAAYLDAKRERSKEQGRRFIDFMNRMRQRPGSLAKAMADLYESLSKNEGALITINRIETHLQLPPILRETRRMLFSADLETERDLFEAHLGMADYAWELEHGAGLGGGGGGAGLGHPSAYYDSTWKGAGPYGTANGPLMGYGYGYGYGASHALDPQAYQYEEWKRTTGPHLVPWKTLLMLKNHKGDAGGPLSSSNNKRTAEQGRLSASGPAGVTTLGTAKGGHRRADSQGSFMSRFASLGMSSASGSGSGGAGRHSQGHANLARMSGSGSGNGHGQAAAHLAGTAGAEMGLTPSGGPGSSSRRSTLASVEAEADGRGAEADDEDDHAGGGAGGRRGTRASTSVPPHHADGSTLNLLSSLGIDGDGTFAADEEMTLLEARGIEAWVPRFAIELEPKLDGIPTLKELAVNLNWDLYQDVYPMVRHLIYYREARVIDVPFITNIYTISPLVDVANLGRLSRDWQAAFPMLPQLVRVLSQLSSSARPFERQLDTACRFALSSPTPPSPSPLELDIIARQELYLDALFWLLRTEVVVHIQIRYRIVATEEVQRRAREWRRADQVARYKAREEARAAREEARAEVERQREAVEMESVEAEIAAAAVESKSSPRGAVQLAGELTLAVPKLEDVESKPRGGRPSPSGEQSNDPGKQHDSASRRLLPGLTDRGDAGTKDEHLNGVDEELLSSEEEDWERQHGELVPTLIAEPGRPSKEEAYCLEVMMEGLSSDLEAVFREALPFFNGKHSLDEIVSRRDLSLDKLRALIRKQAGYFIAFFHP